MSSHLVLNGSHCRSDREEPLEGLVKVILVQAIPPPVRGILVGGILVGILVGGRQRRLGRLGTAEADVLQG